MAELYFEPSQRQEFPPEVHSEVFSQPGSERLLVKTNTGEAIAAYYVLQEFSGMET